MDISIKDSIVNNFKDSDIKDIKAAIVDAMKDMEEITLPGLGVFFELLWNNSTDEEHDKYLEKIQKGIKKITSR